MLFTPPLTNSPHCRPIPIPEADLPREDSPSRPVRVPHLHRLRPPRAPDPLVAGRHLAAVHSARRPGQLVPDQQRGCCQLGQLHVGRRDGRGLVLLRGRQRCRERRLLEEAQCVRALVHQDCQ